MQKPTIQGLISATISRRRRHSAFFLAARRSGAGRAGAEAPASTAGVLTGQPLTRERGGAPELPQAPRFPGGGPRAPPATFPGGGTGGVPPSTPPSERGGPGGKTGFPP